MVAANASNGKLWMGEDDDEQQPALRVSEVAILETLQLGAGGAGLPGYKVAPGWKHHPRLDASWLELRCWLTLASCR